MRITNGPWQRALGLATLHLDTAGNNVHAVARYRTADEASELARTSRQRDTAYLQVRSSS